MTDNEIMLIIAIGFLSFLSGYVAGKRMSHHSILDVKLDDLKVLIQTVDRKVTKRPSHVHNYEIRDEPSTTDDTPTYYP